MNKDVKKERTKAPRRTLSRRRLLGLGAAAAAGGLALLGSSRLSNRGSRAAGTGRGPVVVSSSCKRCTGCVAVCPEAALSLGPGCRIVVSEEKCTRCGYCVAVCSADALTVTREPQNG